MLADLIQDTWFDVILLALVAVVVAALVFLAWAGYRAWKGISAFLAQFDDDLRTLKKRVGSDDQ